MKPKTPQGKTQMPRLLPTSLQRAGEGDEVGAGLAVLRDARQRIHHAVLAHGDGVDVERALAVLVEDGAVVGVFAGLDVVGDQVQVFEALGFAHRGLGLAGQALAVDVDRAAGQVMDGLAVRAEREAEVAIAELVEHAATLGGLRGDAVEHFDARHARVEPEQVARVAVDAVDQSCHSGARRSAASCSPCGPGWSGRRGRSNPSSCLRLRRARRYPWQAL